MGNVDVPESIQNCLKVFKIGCYNFSIARFMRLAVNGEHRQFLIELKSAKRENLNNLAYYYELGIVNDDYRNNRYRSINEAYETLIEWIKSLNNSDTLDMFYR